MIAFLLAAAVSPAMAACKDYADCREAVIAWCAGRLPGADRDGDGIPCEIVCGSLDEVRAIMAEIGCAR